MALSTSVLLVIAFVGPVFGAEIVPARETLVVHEWGTFTTVAGDSGEAVPWVFNVETGDLPCFVNRLGPNPKAGLALVRMETPVLYFYPQRDMTLSVHVTFPQGWITEWYPQATQVTPRPASIVGLSYRDGGISWDGVEVSPGGEPEFPNGKGASRYYAARHTDSAPLAIGGQREKMIFYRGIGNFAIPLRASLDGQGRLEIRNTGAAAVPMAIWFENRGGKVGYRMVRDVRGASKIEPLILGGDVSELQASLTSALVENGLYPKEAAAMLETWRDSWFEAGNRLIYIVPSLMLDEVLPLSIAPAATSVSRVFVGRIEMLTPADRQAIDTGFATRDVPSLTKFGRFLEPFVEQIRNRNPGLLASREAAALLGQTRVTVSKALQGKCID